MLKEKKNHEWNTADGHSPLVAYLSSVAPLPKEVVDLVDANTFKVSVAKGKFLLKPGSLTTHLYFISKGVVQGCIKEEGRMITTWINEENELVGSIRTLGTKEPCREYLQALEDTELVAVAYDFTEFIFNHYPKTNFIARRLWEYNYRGAEERAYLCRIRTAEKKYKRFLEMHPGLINRISHKYIASYLGMTLETLSRIRNRKK
jgi:CRP-like cAMP-binding protein